MATWNIYTSFNGSPLYASFDIDEDITEDEAWDWAMEEIGSNLEVTKED